MDMLFASKISVFARFFELFGGLGLTKSFFCVIVGLHCNANV